MICHARGKNGADPNSSFPFECLDQFLSKLILHTAQVIAQAIRKVTACRLKTMLELLPAPILSFAFPSFVLGMPIGPVERSPAKSKGVPSK